MSHLTGCHFVSTFQPFILDLDWVKKGYTKELVFFLFHFYSEP